MAPFIQAAIFCLRVLLDSCWLFVCSTTLQYTGHNWLSTYRKKIGYGDDDRCGCGAQETVTHVLVDCPRLVELRRKLRREVGDAFNNVSSLLGGSKQGEKGKPDTVSRAKTVQAVLDFAEASQRFRSRAPRGQPNNGNGN
jgi:hypothetical protein